MTLPADYIERVYAGILGKLVGVYLGRPFEGWTYGRIVAELGSIETYVNERFDQPLVVTDDDVAGTFTFLRALEEHRVSPDLSAAEIGRTWLNHLIEGRSVLWWGGNGTSTEHTAWLNLRRGIPAPASGSAAVNGRGIAEQIGAQIFVDGWAMVSPGRPALAVRLAREAARVSHDGEAVHAASLWAAMEAEAFLSADPDHLLDTGLGFIPPDALIARLIADVRGWHRAHPDWRDTRARIEERYGYDRFPGICHVVPNHALMIMALLYAGGDFRAAMRIVNTSGWDTDCNAGNVGCLLGLMHGLSALDAGPVDWRGPIADRCLISSADGGEAVNDAVRLSYRVAGLGARLAGAEALPPPKGGARFHFSLPGSVQGFSVGRGEGLHDALELENVSFEGSRALALRYRALEPGRTALATTPVFAPPDAPGMRSYELMASPLVYPGQTVRARVMAPGTNRGTVTAALRARVYGADDRFDDLGAEPAALAPGAEAELAWTLPALGGQPVAEIGLAVEADETADGAVILDRLGWDGVPDLVLHRPAAPGDFWRRAWVNGASSFSAQFTESFRVSQSRGQGIVIHGTREWRDYRVAADLTVHLGLHAGLAARVQGLRRFYAARLVRGDLLQIVRVRDEETRVLAECAFPWAFDRACPFALEVAGPRIACRVGDARLIAEDADDQAFRDGGIGLLVFEGALSADAVRVGPCALL